MKIPVKKLTIKEKIYIKKDDVEDPEHLKSVFTYNTGDTLISSLDETDEHYIIPSNGYFKLSWDEVEDNRNFVKLDKQLVFEGVLRSEQQEVVDKLFVNGNARSGLIQAPPGWGKCKPISSFILTDKGLLSLAELENLQPQVFSMNSLSNVVGYHYNGKKSCLLVHTEAGNKITGTHNHPVLTMNNDFNIGFKMLCELAIGDFVVGILGTDLFGNVSIDKVELLGEYLATLVTNNIPQNIRSLHKSDMRLLVREFLSTTTRRHTEKQIAFEINNELLADFIFIQLLNFGIRTNCFYENDKYIIACEFNSFHDIIYNKKSVEPSMYITKVVGIEDLGIRETADIEIADDSHAYVSEGIINHNTFTACNLIARNNTKTIVLTHTTLLFEQWISEVQKQVPNAKIGKIGDGFFSIGDITIAIYKSAYNNLDKLKDVFSTVIVDEAHKCPAETFSKVVNNLNAKVKIAITATPQRKDGKHRFLADYFSPYKIIAEDTRKLAIPSVTIKPTDFRFNILNPKRDWVNAMNKLCESTEYHKLVASTAISYIKQRRCPLIIAERVYMLKELEKMIPNSICVIGETDKAIREDALTGLGTKYSAILTTKLFDEGISCHRLDTLFFTCPSNNPVQWEQRIGRIERLHPDKQNPLIVDFWLSGAIVSRQQNTRLAWYKQRGYNIL